MASNKGLKAAQAKMRKSGQSAKQKRASIANLRKARAVKKKLGASKPSRYSYGKTYKVAPRRNPRTGNFAGSKRVK